MSKYIQGHTENVLKAHGSRTATNTCQYFLPLLKPDFEVLDVGCGPGSITTTVAPLVPQGRIVGVDSGEKAIQAASERSDLPSNCSFRVGNAMDLPYEADSFDVVYTSQLLCHLPDPVGAMTEFRRVCKVGGFVACREADGGSAIIHPPHPGLELWRTSQAKVQDIVSARSDAGRLLIEWALGAGFAEGSVQFSAGDMTYAGDSREGFGTTFAARLREDQEWRWNVLENGIADERGLEMITEGWDAWAKEKAGVFSLICGQVVCYK